MCCWSARLAWLLCNGGEFASGMWRRHRTGDLRTCSFPNRIQGSWNPGAEVGWTIVTHARNDSSGVFSFPSHNPGLCEVRSPAVKGYALSLGHAPSVGYAWDIPAARVLRVSCIYGSAVEKRGQPPISDKWLWSLLNSGIGGEYIWDSGLNTSRACLSFWAKCKLLFRQA